MAKKKTSGGGSDILENPEVLQEKLTSAELFIERNRKIFIGLLAVVLLVVAGLLGYRYWLNNQENKPRMRSSRLNYILNRIA